MKIIASTESNSISDIKQLEMCLECLQDYEDCLNSLNPVLYEVLKQRVGKNIRFGLMEQKNHLKKMLAALDK